MLSAPVRPAGAKRTATSAQRSRRRTFREHGTRRGRRRRFPPPTALTSAANRTPDRKNTIPPHRHILSLRDHTLAVGEGVASAPRWTATTTIREREREITTWPWPFAYPERSFRPSFPQSAELRSERGVASKKLNHFSSA
jgi:hypothetical protein